MIDENAWDAGYEAGVRDQRKASEQEIARLAYELEHASRLLRVYRAATDAMRDILK